MFGRSAAPDETVTMVPPPLSIIGCSTARDSMVYSRMEIERAPAEAMIKSQMPLEEKIKKADHVAWNNGGRTVLAAEAVNLVELWRQEKWTKS